MCINTVTVFNNFILVFRTCVVCRCKMMCYTSYNHMHIHAHINQTSSSIYFVLVYVKISLQSIMSFSL